MASTETICLICGLYYSFKSEPDEENSIYLLEKLCRVLKISGWVGDGSVCSNCEAQIILISEVNEKISELKKELEGLLRDFRDICEGAGNTFGRQDVYGRAPKYLEFRQKLLSAMSLGSAGPPPKSRNSVKLERKDENNSKSTSGITDHSPIVLISTEDRLKAERFSQIKIEVDTAELPPDVDLWLSPPHFPDDNDSDWHPPTPPSASVKSPSPKRKKTNNILNVSTKKRRVGRPKGQRPKATVATKRHNRIIKNPSGSLTFLHVTFLPTQTKSSYKCMECSTTISKSDIRNHTHKEHTTGFTCHKCGRTYFSPYRLKRHIHEFHTSTRDKWKERPVCGKLCHRSHMKAHIYSHYSAEEKAEAISRGEKGLRRTDASGDKATFQCELCGKAFLRRERLQTHMLSKHPAPEEEEIKALQKELCPECGKLIAKYCMKTHMLRTHKISSNPNLSVGNVSNDPTYVKPFACGICAKRFWTNVLLTRHKERVHEGRLDKGKHSCEICGRGFYSTTQLKSHLNRHNNIRPFPCTECDMAFFTKSNLKVHNNKFHAEGARPGRKQYVRGTTKVKSDDKFNF